MLTTITFGGADKSGSLARIAAFLARHGYASKGHQFTESPSGAKLLVVKIESPAIDVNALAAELKSLHPEYSIVDSAEEGSEAGPDLVELVKQVVGQYPNIVPLVREYADAFHGGARDRHLLEAGKKVGAFIYTKDWSLGSPLKMPVALRRTLVPALEKLCKLDATDATVTLTESPLCGADGEPGCCEFLTGFMQGFLGAGRLTRDTEVRKAGCRKAGTGGCTYTFKYAAGS